MKKWMIAASAAAMTATSACADYGDGYGRPGYASGDDYWDAPRYYRDGRYEERDLGRDERVYRGRDGRYYCRRSDGSAGLIVGGLAGGVLGSILAPGGSKTLGVILGAAGGAAIGSTADPAGKVRCR